MMSSKLHPSIVKTSAMNRQIKSTFIKFTFALMKPAAFESAFALGRRVVPSKFSRKLMAQFETPDSPIDTHVLSANAACQF